MMYYPIDHTGPTNDTICCNSSTSAGRNIDNGSEKLINTETDTVTTNDERNNGEVVAAEVEAEAEVTKNSKKSNSSNTYASSKRTTKERDKNVPSY